MDGETKERAVEIAPIGKDGTYLMGVIDGGGMAAMLCGSEVLYCFLGDGMYQCFIHLLGGSDGRRRAFERTDANREMLKSFALQADQLFEVAYPPELNPMGVMYTAEQAILGLLDTLGIKPAP